MAVPIPIILAPEALAWGAGALGTGLATLGIIENKDAIRDGVNSLGASLKRGAENAIRTASYEMSPKRPVQNPSIDPSTGAYVAVPDATRVTPYVRTLLPEALTTSGVIMTANGSSSTGNSSTGTAQPSRKPRSRKKPTTTAPTNTGTNTGTTGTNTAAPNPRPENENDSTTKAWYTKPWETAKNSPKTSAWGRGVRNFGVRVPAYTGVAAPLLDLTGNAIGASKEDPNTAHQWIFPLTKARFGVESGIYKLVGDQYSTRPIEPDSSVIQSVSQPGDTIVVTTGAPQGPRIGNGLVWQQ